jgi:hypothetical protein
VGRIPVERTTLYDVVRRFDDPAMDPESLEPKQDIDLAGPARSRRSLETAEVARSANAPAA